MVAAAAAAATMALKNSEIGLSNKTLRLSAGSYYLLLLSTRPK